MFFRQYFFRQPNFQNPNFWQLIWRMCFFISVLFIPQAVAAPLEQYCISQVGQKPKPQFDEIKRESEPLTISVKGEQFQVVEKNDFIELKRSKDSSLLAKIHAKQYEYGGITDLALTKDGWLWMDGDETDYMAKLDLQTMPPTLGSPVALPKLYTNPCSAWARFWDNCILEGGTYSPTLGRVFITGHRGTFWGGSALVSYEIVAGQPKLLPEKAQGARLVYGAPLIFEVPKLKGVLLRGASGEPLFYDGVKVTTLLSGELVRDKDDGKNPWYIESTKSGRTFLTNAGLSRKPIFLAEIEAGLKLRPISIPDALAESLLHLIQLTDDTPMLGVTDKGIYLEVENSLKIVATVPEKLFIHIPPGIKQSPDGSLYFVLTNLTTGSTTDYFLVRSSPTSRCQATLNPSKPVLFGNE